jgi:hypothetical protein
MFGLDVRAEGEMPAVAAAGAEPTGRALELRLDPEAPERLGFPAGAAAISDQREADGGLVFQIEHDEAAGYLVWGPRYGASLLRADGGAVLGRPGEGGFEAWHRLLIAQVLPFAAILRGLEALHAGAVLADGGAVALVGRPGAGKSTTAAALRRLGCAFLADDVLALERRDGALIAHPGAPFQAAPEDREALLPVEGGGGAAELGAVFFLDRRADGPAEPGFEPILDPRLLIASTFNAVLLSPARQRRLLEICGEIAARRVERVAAGPAVGPERIAAAIAARLEERR